MQIDPPTSLGSDAGGNALDDHAELNALDDHAELNEIPDEAESACSTSDDNSDNVQLCSSEGTFIHVAAAAALNASNVENATS